jgi:hypothetical protein
LAASSAISSAARFSSISYQAYRSSAMNWRPLSSMVAERKDNSTIAALMGSS